MKSQYAIARDLSQEINSKIKNIDDIILFGSVARAETNSGSDIDLLLVANRLEPDIYKMLSKTSLTIEPLVRYGSFIRYGKSNKSIHVLYCSENDLDCDWPIMNNIKHEGISLLY